MIFIINKKVRKFKYKILILSEVIQLSYLVVKIWKIVCII